MKTSISEANGLLLSNISLTYMVAPPTDYKVCHCFSAFWLRLRCSYLFSELHTALGCSGWTDLGSNSSHPTRPLDQGAVTAPPPNEGYPRVAQTHTRKKKKSMTHPHLIEAIPIKISGVKTLTCLLKIFVHVFI